MASMFWSKRAAKTTLPCDRCQAPLTARRGCREVTLECETCKARFPLEAYSRRMDEALEQFLENVFCDRM